MIRGAIFATAVVTLLNAPAAGAQLWRRPPQLIGVGDRVRVGIRDDTSRAPLAMAGQHIHGIVHAIAPETLYIDLPQALGTIPVPRAAIRGVQVSMGTPSRAATAVDFGSGGALLGGLFLPSLIPHARQRFGSFGKAAAAGVGIGLGIGALIGALLPHEYWGVAWIPE